MSQEHAEPKLRYCSFCGKHNQEVALMIAGPTDGLFICNEDVAICAVIVLAKISEEAAHNDVSSANNKNSEE